MGKVVLAERSYKKLVHNCEEGRVPPCSKVKI